MPYDKGGFTPWNLGTIDREEDRFKRLYMIGWVLKPTIEFHPLCLSSKVCSVRYEGQEFKMSAIQLIYSNHVNWFTQLMSAEKKGFHQLKKIISYHTENSSSTKVAETEFKEFEPRLRIWDAAQLWLVALKIVFNISRLKPVFGGFATRLKFIKFELGFTLIQLMEVVQLDQNSFNVSYS